MSNLIVNRATLSKRGDDVVLQCEDGEHAAAVFEYIDGVEVEVQRLREENERLKRLLERIQDELYRSNRAVAEEGDLGGSSLSAGLCMELDDAMSKMSRG